MSCPRQLEVSVYIDDMMQPAERRQFTRHLEECPICQARLDALAVLRQDLRDMPSPSLGFDLAARLEDQRRMRPAPRQAPRPSWFGWGSGGLAVALALSSGVWLGSLLLGGSTVVMPGAGVARVFDPVPPGGLCAAPELCRLSKGLP